MSPDEVAAFLESERKVQLASNGGGGHPHLVTLFYALDEGRLAVTTHRASQKVANLRRDPAVTCLVETGERFGELRAVTVYGRAVIVEEPAEVLRLGGEVARRMYGLDVLPEDVAGLLPAMMAKRVAVVIEPLRVLTLDQG